MGSADVLEYAELSLERVSSDSPLPSLLPSPFAHPTRPSLPACLLSGCGSAPLSLWLLVCEVGRHPLDLGINPDPGAAFGTVRLAPGGGSEPVG